MTHPVPDHEHLLSVEQAANYLGIGRTKTYELVMSGAVASIKMGARRLISVRSVTSYLREKVGGTGLRDQFTKDALGALIDSGEVQAITLGQYLFVSVDSLADYVSRQLGNTDLLQAATDSDQRFGKQLAGGLDQ